MARIGVFHPFWGRGGAEAVCCNLLEAIQSNHDVTVLAADQFDIAAYNEYFNTDINEGLSVHTPPVLDRLFPWSLDCCRKFIGQPLGRLHAGPIARWARRQSDFDLFISTFNEFLPGTPALLYVHYPALGRSYLPDEIEPASIPNTAYDTACQWISGHEPSAVREATLLANSEWTANLVEQIYDHSPRVVYPPVDTTGFNQRAWGAREDGVLLIGAVTPRKNVQRSIKILDGVRAAGHDIHAHIIGPIPESDYASTVSQLVADRSYCSLEGMVDRETLVTYLCTHKYGLHGMDNEHFGIVVAELVAAGALPFIPDGGGQREIVHRRPELIYATATEAIEQIRSVLNDPELQADLRDALAGTSDHYSPERFQATMAKIINQCC